MKKILTLAASIVLASLWHGSVFADVSCTNDRICAGGQTCQSGFCADAPVTSSKLARPVSVTKDKLGLQKTKNDCETVGGVWAGEAGKGSCTGPLPTFKYELLKADHCKMGGPPFPGTTDPQLKELCFKKFGVFRGVRPKK